MKQSKNRKSSSMQFRQVMMPQGEWGSDVTLSDEKETNTQLLTCDVKEEAVDEEDVTFDSLLSQENGRTKRQRKRSVYSSVKPKSRKHDSTVERWSAERYKQAERNLLEILKAEGAVFGKPITRPVLRVAGRKRIGDTGLLDHLLKHIDGKVAPGGLERFRRWFNTDGVMEYWLESVELANMRLEAGVDDPYWVPPSWWKPGGGPLQQPASAADLNQLREEMSDMKRDLEQRVCKRQDQFHVSVLKELQEEFLGWRAKTDQRLMELSSSLSGMQDMFRDLITWKEKTEQQLMEISNALSSIQAPKQNNATLSPPAERWEDWLENNNLDNIHGEDIPASWFETTYHEQEKVAMQNTSSLLPTRLKQMEGPAQDPDRSKELDALREEVGKLRRELSEVTAKKQGLDTEYQTKGAPAFTTRQKVEADNPLILLQEMLKEWAKWKPQVEQQLMDISAVVSSMQMPMQIPSFGQPRFYR